MPHKAIVELVEEFNKKVSEAYQILPVNAVPWRVFRERLCEIITQIPAEWGVRARAACQELQPTIEDIIAVLREDIDEHAMEPDRILLLHTLIRSAILIRSCELIQRTHNQ